MLISVASNLNYFLSLSNHWCARPFPQSNKINDIKAIVVLTREILREQQEKERDGVNCPVPALLHLLAQKTTISSQISDLRTRSSFGMKTVRSKLLNSLCKCFQLSAFMGGSGPPDLPEPCSTKSYHPFTVRLLWLLSIYVVR